MTENNIQQALMIFSAKGEVCLKSREEDRCKLSRNNELIEWFNEYPCPINGALYYETP